MTQEELLKQIRKILNELPFGERGYLYKQTAFDACVKTAEWLQEQMMNDDTFLVAIGDAYVDWIDGGINTNDENPADYIRNRVKESVNY